MKKSFTCIVCPRGCRLSGERRDGAFHISGHGCRRGLEYAETELTAPVRTLTTTLRTAFPDCPALPVRTSAPVPKDRIMEIMRALRTLRVDTRPGTGDVILPRILGLDCDILCTSDLLSDAAPAGDPAGSP
ncbi:MAG: DUF1667 domain-containing protein [Clostridia bacterium]|nr:DUF1667 domain-containing protein [Clostridia bacterium]